MNDFSLTVSDVMTKNLFSSAQLIIDTKGQFSVINLLRELYIEEKKGMVTRR